MAVVQVASKLYDVGHFVIVFSLRSALSTDIAAEVVAYALSIAFQLLRFFCTFIRVSLFFISFPFAVPASSGLKNSLISSSHLKKKTETYPNLPTSHHSHARFQKRLHTASQHVIGTTFQLPNGGLNRRNGTNLTMRNTILA